MTNPDLMSIDEQLWIGLLYACAVLRGVIPHPFPWPWALPPVGYVLRVDP